MNKKYLWALIVPLLVGCSAKNQNSAASGDRVLSRAEGYDHTPEWAMIKPRFIENDIIYVSGAQDISSTQSPSRACIAADVQAKANLIAEIKTRLQSQLQLANEDFDYDKSLLNQIVNMATDVKFVTGLQVSKRYYEKVLNETGYEKQVRYGCYSLAALSMEEFKRNVARALRDAEGKQSISKEFQAKVDHSWNKFFEQDEPATAEAPKSEEKVVAEKPKDEPQN